MAKRALIAVAAGGLSAAAWLSVTAGVPGGLLLSYFAPLPLLWVGLTAGPAAVAIAGLAGAVAAGILGGLVAAEAFLGVHALPAWMVVALALARRPVAVANGGTAAAGFAYLAPGIILACLAVAAALGLLALGVIQSGDDGIEAGVRAFIEGFAVTPPGGEDAEVTPLAVLAPLAPVFLGFLAMAWQMMVVINALLAQRLAVKAGTAIRPSPPWSAVVLPDWLSWLLAGSAALALISGGDVGYLAQNATVALAVPYFFAGLAAVHRLAARASARRLLLGVFYALLVIMFLVMVVIVIAIGVFDQWLGARQRDGRDLIKKE